MIVKFFLKVSFRLFLTTSSQNASRRQFNFSKTFIFAAVFFFSTFNFVEAGNVSGRITKNNGSVEQAVITFTKQDKSVSSITNKNGNYQIFLEPGLYKMEIKKDGKCSGPFWVRSARHNVNKNIDIR
jgi:hypothetical protein